MREWCRLFKIPRNRFISETMQNRILFELGGDKEEDFEISYRRGSDPFKQKLNYNLIICR